MSASELRPDDRAPNLWLSGEVVIGDVQIGANVVIEGPARIGEHVRFGQVPDGLRSRPTPARAAATATTTGP